MQYGDPVPEGLPADHRVDTRSQCLPFKKHCNLDLGPDPQPPPQHHVPKPHKTRDFLNLQHFPSMLPSLHTITALTDVLAAIS